MSEVMRIGSIIIFNLSKLWKAMFFILCDVILPVRLQEKFELGHSWEWKGWILRLIFFVSFLQQKENCYEPYPTDQVQHITHQLLWSVKFCYRFIEGQRPWAVTLRTASLWTQQACGPLACCVRRPTDRAHSRILFPCARECQLTSAQFRE